MNHRYSRTRIVLLQDSILSGLASLLSILLVRWSYDPIPGFSSTVILWVVVAISATLLASLVCGSHKAIRRKATVRSAASLVYTVLLKELVLAAMLLTGLVKLPELSTSLLAVFADTMITLAALFYVRVVARMLSKTEVRHIKRDASLKNALIAGADEEAEALAQQLVASGGFSIIGFVTKDPALSGRVIGDVVVYHCGSMDDLHKLEWRLGGIDCIFFPKNNEYTGDPDPAAGEESAEPHTDGMSLFGRVAKRSFDAVASFILILIFLPLAALSALAVWLEDRGPVIFRQERIGKGGKVFNILKFRSMRTDAEAAGAQLYSGETDPRLTRVGAFLRAHHLDELPQLWNVFRGDMSFIGYRPERQVFIDKITEYNPRYKYLYQIRPGVTSYATLYNGYTDTIEKMLTRLDLDLYYLRNRSVVFDLRILALTFFSIIFGKKF